MTAERSGAVLERGRRVRGGERRVRNEDPKIAQFGDATGVGSVPDGDGTDGCRSAQIHLPPRVWKAAGCQCHRTVKEIPVGVAIHCKPSDGGGVIVGALGSRFIERQIRAGKYLYLGEAQVVRTAELHPHVPAYRAAGSHERGGVGSGRLVAAECPGTILQGRGRVRRKERSVRNEDPKVVQSSTAAIRAIPDDDGADRRRSA